MLFLNLGKYDDALREFELTKDIDPAFSKAYVGSGLVWAYKDDCRRGLKHIEKAKMLANTDEEKVFADTGRIRLYVIGKESAHRNWLQEAESAHKDVVVLLPDSSEAHYYMGWAYMEGRDFKKARQLFESVLEIDNAYVREARQAISFIDYRKRQGLSP
jgi:tetratricopeptide (TPR) repeat protein